MSKRVNRGARIILGRKDISDIVTRWSVGAKVGELYEAEIDVLDKSDRIQIIQPESSFNRWSKKPQTASQGAEIAHDRLRLATNDKILVGGSDISSWIIGYEKITRVGNADVIRLHVQCDSAVLSINGTHPWEDVL